MKGLNLYIVSVVCFILLACNKEEIGPQQVNKSDLITEDYAVLVACEGNFGWGNASLTAYYPETKQVSNNVFSAVNSFALGDVAQSITEIDGKLFIVVNNSGKIVVVDKNDYKFIAQIEGLVSPRFIKQVAPNKAYVTDLYANKITIINTQTHTITGEIPLQGWSEEMVVVGLNVFISIANSDKLIIVDALKDKVISELTIGESPSGLSVDKDNKVWVLTHGGNQKELPLLQRINPVSFEIEKRLEFSNIDMSPSSLKIDFSGENLFYLNNGVFVSNIYSNELPAQPLIFEENRLFYGLGIDPVLNEIYVSDAIDYIQNGIIYRYSSQGNLLDSVKSGIIPQYFQFVSP